MYKAILATIFSISLILYPVNAQAPATDGLSDIYIETDAEFINMWESFCEKFLIEISYVQIDVCRFGFEHLF